DPGAQLEPVPTRHDEHAGALDQLHAVAGRDVGAPRDGVDLATGPLDHGRALHLEAGLAGVGAVIGAGDGSQAEDGDQGRDEPAAPHAPPSGSAPFPAGAGKIIEKREPLVGTDSQVSSPPWARTMRWTRASPRPSPPKRRVAEASPWLKSSKIVLSRSGGMPTPSSLTHTRMAAPSDPSTDVAPTTTLPPAGEYFTALSMSS